MYITYYISIPTNGKLILIVANAVSSSVPIPARFNFISQGILGSKLSTISMPIPPPTALAATQNGSFDLDPPPL